MQLCITKSVPVPTYKLYNFLVGIEGPFKSSSILDQSPAKKSGINRFCAKLSGRKNSDQVGTGWPQPMDVVVYVKQRHWQKLWSSFRDSNKNKSVEEVFNIFGEQNFHQLF